MEYKRAQFSEILSRPYPKMFCLMSVSCLAGREKNDEVDFVLLRGGKKVALEVKSGKRTYNSGLATFAKLYNPHKSLVIGSGGLSFEEFLSLDLNLLFSH